MRLRSALPLLLFLVLGTTLAHRAPAAIVPTIVDLDVGESQRVTLHDGSTAVVKVLSIDSHREAVTRTLSRIVATVEVNGQRAELVCGNYRLPVSVGGAQVDFPAARVFMEDSNVDWWVLLKAARVRVWPGNSPWIEPGTFVYPVRQRWFASATAFSNEPVSRRPKPGAKVYYHAGMDLGGSEGLIEVLAATDAVILSLGVATAPGEKHPAVQPRYDVIYALDQRGWAYRYSHLMTFDPALQVGGRIKKGQRLGYIGKEGSSGGWTHLHFHVECLQPSGKWGVQDSYAFLWQAYREQYDPAVIAVARPHQKALVGEAVSLDASLSWTKTGVGTFEWSLMDGTKATGPTVRRTYDRPGIYSEIVKVSDGAGNFDYDFASVRVYAGNAPDGTASVVGVHATYAPTFGIKPGDPVIFRSRARETRIGADLFDFGDNTPQVSVPSNIDGAQHAANGYGMVVHHYRQPGHYLVRVERRDEPTGAVAVQHLHVIVER
jgi:hypothetical protein